LHGPENIGNILGRYLHGREDGGIVGKWLPKHLVEVLDDGPLAAREAGPEARPG
jgi:hypothetical protein